MQPLPLRLLSKKLKESGCTDIHALPSLQFGKAFMLLSLAELEPELAQEATAEADATIEEAVAAMYVEGEGVWACIYPNGTRSDLIRF